MFVSFYACKSVLKLVLEMAVDPENVSRVLSVLLHRIRREILLILNEKGERSFTDLLNELNVDTGKLSFHIKTLHPSLSRHQLENTS